MSIHVFVYLPDTPDALYRVLDASASPEQFLEELIKAAGNVRSIPSSKLFYDSTNIQHFITLADLEEHNELIKRLRLALSRTATNILDNPRHESDCIYALWNFDLAQVQTPVPIVLSEVLEHIIRFPEHQYLLLNFYGSIPACRAFLLLFKDAKHKTDYPTHFIKLPFASDVTELVSWLDTHFQKIFDLKDTTRFQRTDLSVQGTKVYKEIETGRYWYLDNFHKDEYEVFDAQGKHLGVADLSGKLDTTLKVQGRTLTL